MLDSSQVRTIIYRERFLHTVLYRDYAHPYCMLQSSYRWDGLNFENSSFASKLRPLMKSFLSASEACQLLKYNEFINNYTTIVCMGEVARYKEKYKSRFCIRRLFFVTVRVFKRFREDCPCLLYLQIGDLAIFRANHAACAYTRNCYKPFLDN